MAQCLRCSAELADHAHFCSSCGEPFLLGSAVATLARESNLKAEGGDLAHLQADRKGQAVLPNLAFGTILVGRYRIHSILGHGGMGVVYRADDLKLGQTVALKFLPPSLARNGEHLDRFLGEVRSARQVSHPNVCRVYDIGEADGYYFLSMEYVDGENLATLLARIGRLPTTKALEIAHELCGGLAAVHARQVVHRDLKPTNIMIDGRGHARITDFGLAILPQDPRASELAGTPPYMAPELFEGKPASVQSDLYALGIVLYELHTGKHPWDRQLASDRTGKGSTKAPHLPSHHAPEVDPAVDRIILRCLEGSPLARPASVLQVAAALPGGNPLALAIAAGETPSPELVAAAGEQGGLKARHAWGLLAGVAVGLGLLMFLAGHGMLANLVSVKDPTLLIERARLVASSLGYADPAVDSAYWYDVDSAYSNSAKAPAMSSYRGLALATPSPLRFWYRQSPRRLETAQSRFVVDAQDPPLFYSGEIQVGMDSDGRLSYFAAIGPQEDAPSGGNGDSAAWPSLFTAAGLDFSESQPVAGGWLPDVPTDRSLAWEIKVGERTTRVVGATYHGRVVFFRVLDRWAQPTRMTASEGPSMARLAFTLTVATALAILFICFFLARRNLALGRGDRRGVFRAGAAYFAVLFGGCLLRAHYSASAPWVWTFFHVSLGLAIGNALQFGVIYVALEPYVRRTWPEILISWSRLLAGGWRDALVGRDLLIGTLLGVSAAAIVVLRTALAYWFPIAGVSASAAGIDTMLTTVPSFLGNLCLEAPSLMNALATLAVLFITAQLTGRRTIAVLFTFVLSLVLNLRGGPLWVDVPLTALFALTMLGGLLRFGLLASVVSEVVYSMCRLPLTTDLSRWYAWRGLFVVALLFGTATYGFKRALAGRPAFGTAFED